MNRRDLIKGAVLAACLPSCAAPDKFQPLVASHLENLVAHGTDRYGPEQTPMWMASLDLTTKAYPESQPMALAGRRVYRDIASPFGSSIYWDIPQLVASYELTKLTGNSSYVDAANRYVSAFLKTGIDEHGVFEWGNHRYYDAYKDHVAHFSGGPHEMRPITPCWEVFWRQDAAVTERQIRQSALRHLIDPETGSFNRHDTPGSQHAFLEAGGILVESLCWLHARKPDPTQVDLALRIARYSFEHRGAATGLVENNPSVTRWDKHVCTTEIGVWAASLLRAADLSGKEEFQRMADDAVSAYLRYGYDESTRRYFGQLRVADGTPVLKENPVPGPEEYWPGNHADIWNANFPAHDYPMALASVCVDLYRRTKAERFGEAIRRFAGAVAEQPLPTTAKDGRGGYAELYGRAIQFLAYATEVTGDSSYRGTAFELARHAKETLYVNGMFRGHAGEDRYDAVDGVGYLLLAMLYLDAGRQADYLGFGF